MFKKRNSFVHIENDMELFFFEGWGSLRWNSEGIVEWFGRLG